MTSVISRRTARAAMAGSLAVLRIGTARAAADRQGEALNDEIPPDAVEGLTSLPSQSLALQVESIGLVA